MRTQVCVRLSYARYYIPGVQYVRRPGVATDVLGLTGNTHCVQYSTVLVSMHNVRCCQELLLSSTGPTHLRRAALYSAACRPCAARFLACVN